MVSERSLILTVVPSVVPRNWRDPDARAAHSLDGSLMIEIAQRAEAAAVHALFLFDGSSTIPENPRPTLEPITLLSSVAQHTERIGLVATVSSSWYEPYTLARLIASLDLLSGGRAGWNVVTSAVGIENFGGGSHDHDERYARAEEFVDVVKALWGSWGAGAIDWSATAGSFVREGRVSTIDWAGERFRVKGPLNVPRSPQGRPTISQAGASEPGRRLGARTADIIFASGRGDPAQAKAFADDLRARARGYGRSEGDVKILPGLSLVIGSTEREATELWEQSRQRFDLDGALPHLSRVFGGFDLTAIDPDAPLSVDLLPAPSQVNSIQSSYSVLYDMVVTGKVTTLRDLAFYSANSSSHWLLVGSPESIADRLIEQFDSGAADGFSILGPFLDYPHGYDAVFDHLIPLLQRRGVFQREYRSGLLRENLGLPPISEER